MAKVAIPAGMLAMFAQKKGPTNDADKQAETPARAPEIEGARADSPPAAGEVLQNAVVPASPEAPAVQAVIPVESGSAGVGDQRTTGAQFRETLDKLDSLMKEQTSDVVVALARDIVKRTMLELRQFPEFAGIVKDSDIRNVFIFLRRLAGEVKLAAEETKAKRAKKAVKDGAVTIPVDMPMDLTMLGNMNFNDVQASLGLRK